MIIWWFFCNFLLSKQLRIYNLLGNKHCCLVYVLLIDFSNVGSQNCFGYPIRCIWWRFQFCNGSWEQSQIRGQIENFGGQRGKNHTLFAADVSLPEVNKLTLSLTQKSTGNIFFPMFLSMLNSIFCYWFNFTLAKNVLHNVFCLNMFIQ